MKEYILLIFRVYFYIIIVMQNELSTNFDEATVEWVDCPDLTQDPFYLAAPGEKSIVRL